MNLGSAKRGLVFPENSCTGRRAYMELMANVAAFSLICLFLVLASQRGEALSSEGVALLAFKHGIVDPRGVLADWDLSDDYPCNWTGIQCDIKSQRVTVINLPRCNLSGKIVPDVGKLGKLHRLFLQFNNLSGFIPPELANCMRIRTISLHHNGLSGEIPPELGNCTLVQALYLQNNMLSGSIPSDLGRMTNLLNLNLSYNQLSGEIPTNGRLLRFEANSFMGNIHLCGKLGFPACPPFPLQPGSNILGLQGPTSSASMQNQGNSHNLKVIEIVAIGVGAFLLLKVFCILYLLRRWSKKNEYQEINLGSGGKLVMFQGGTSLASSKEFLKCIGKLKQKHIIGEGGYGIVYKLVLKDSTTLAVKKLKQCLESVRGFEAELETLGAIKHRNLVKLRGYCTSSTVKLLIYEYLPNGTLGHLLHERKPDQKQLEWCNRQKIALGVARGLAYLHHGCNPRIIHRDVSSNNVLLDANLEPHLADFGLAKLVGLYDTHVTATAAGTFGYMAPEYAEGRKATEKVDVYGYGVLLLELLSGRRPAEMSLHDDDTNLAALVRRLQQEGREAEVLEKYLKDSAPEEELQIALCVACLCISKNPEDRPSMKKVVEILEKDAMSIHSIMIS